MRIKDGYILDTIGDQKVAVSLNMSEDYFSGMIKLNDIGAFLWEKLTEDTDEEKLVEAVTENYEVDAETAGRDIKAFTDVLKKMVFWSKGIWEKRLRNIRLQMPE